MAAQSTTVGFTPEYVGTGKSHLASGLCVAACRQKRRARITDRAHIIETGPDSFRFKRTLANRGKR